MQNILTDLFQSIPHNEVRRIAIKPFGEGWDDELTTLLLRWRWIKYKSKLFSLLHAVNHKHWPEFYIRKAEPSQEVITAMQLLEGINHNVVVFSYFPKTEEIMITTTCVAKPDGRKKPDPRFIHQGSVYPMTVEHGFSLLLPEKHTDFRLNPERVKTPTDLTMYDCSECVAAQRKHTIIRIGAPGGKHTDSHYHQCTGCEAIAGPWQDGGY